VGLERLETGHSTNEGMSDEVEQRGNRGEGNRKSDRM